MKTKYIYASLFIVFSLIQLYIPFHMIQRHEEILKYGKAYRFKIKPVDPSDILRGKYLDLNFENDTISRVGDEFCNRGEKVFVLLENDEKGFARIKGVTRIEPSESQLYIKAKTNYCNYDSLNTINIDFPFDRFYMDEFKMEDADRLYTASSRDTSLETYALVCINHGESVLKDVRIGKKSILELLVKP